MHSGGRHAFWSAPRFGYSTFRALPLLSGGRPVGGVAGPFMGELEASGLDSLSVAAIQNRIVATPLVELYAAEQAQFGGGGGSRAPRGSGQVQPPWDQIGQGRSTLPQLSEAEKAQVRALAENPSSEVLDDLAVIDGFFGVSPISGTGLYEEALTPALCAVMNGRRFVNPFGRGNQVPSLADTIGMWMTYRPTGRWQVRQGGPDEAMIESVRQNPFYCGTPREFDHEINYGPDRADFAGWFGIDVNQPWGAVRTQVKNAITVMEVVARYPFPPPIDLKKAAAFWILSIGEIREIVQTPAPVDPEVVRYWVTMTVLANYSAWVDKIEQDAKKRAKKARRKMIMTAVGLAVASIVAAFLLPAIIAVAVTAIKTAVTTYVDAQKRRKAARDMADAAKMFEADAPAFSKEVDHAAKMLDEQAARDQAAATPSPELEAAIQEVKDDTGPAWGTILPVGGGLAAAGLAAFFILR